MSDRFCALCQSDIEEREPTSPCPECGAVYHVDCHRENGGCGNYGCSLVPTTAAPVVTAPPTVWGREMKQCPSCTREIRAAAVHCRHCGADFATVETISSEAFQQKSEREARLAGIRRRAMTCFVAGAIPCLAPFVLLIGLPLLLRDRATIRLLPPLHRFLGGAGFALAVLWMLIGAAVLAFSGEA